MIVCVKPALIFKQAHALCVKQYPGHKHGCPNFNHKVGCPPNTPNLYDLIEQEPVIAIINEFDLGVHVQRRRNHHPNLTDRQARCLLYWQGTARVQLRKQISGYLKEHSDHVVTTCPEALGVDVTITLANAGIILEWPPIQIVRQVALAGLAREDKPLINFWHVIYG